MVRGYFSPGGMCRGGPNPSALSREGEMKEENGEASTPRALARFLSEEDAINGCISMPLRIMS